MLGQHTAFDLSNLVKAADRELTGIGRGYTALCGSHEMSPEWRQAFEHDYTTLRARYSDARRLAIGKILHYQDMPGVRLDVVPAEAEYAATRAALGTFRDLRTRLATAGIGTSNFGADPESFPATGRVTTKDSGPAGRLHVRASAPSGTVKDDFEHLATISILGPSVGGWYPVSGQGVKGPVSGFASASFITADPTAAAPGVPLITPGVPASPSAPAAATPSAPTGSLGKVTTADTGAAGRLKVHDKPSQAATTIGTYEHGAPVTITGPVVAGFFPTSGVGTGGKLLSGFASASFITPQAGAAPAASPQATPQVSPQAAPQATGGPNLGLPAPVLPKAPGATGKPAGAAAVQQDTGGGDHTNLVLGLGILAAGGLTYGLYRKKAKKKETAA